MPGPFSSDKNKAVLDSNFLLFISLLSYVKVDDVTFMQTQKPEDFGNEYRQRLEEINSQAYNEAMAEQAARNANKPQQEGTPDKSAGPETVSEEIEPNKNNSELYKVADSLQGKKVRTILQAAMGRM